ncbi:tripartite tricarboxylate transporter TctB family protein [Cupriavidus sp.]|uniref:tripartite tricarboxylate transporter TctB family protein n=1 Tax=Cupriavidus sp. TaxID=1873897 RepID=UPI003D099B44
MDAKHSEVPAGGGISARAVELVVAACLMAGALVVIWSNYTIGAGWAADGPEAGYFPLRVGAIILVCSLAVAWQALRGGERKTFATWQQLKQVSVILAPLTVYVGLIGVLGVYLASSIFIVGFMVAIGKSAWWRALLIGLGINVVLFWIFEIQFRVPLPKGPIEAALGY